MPGPSLADRLKEALADKGMTQQALEQEAKVAKGYVRHLKKGSRTKVRAEEAGRVARALGVELGWLLDGVGPKRRASTATSADPMIVQLESWTRANMPGNGVTEEVLARFVSEQVYGGGAGLTLDELYADLLAAARAAKRGKLRVVVDEEEEQVRKTLAAGGATDEEIAEEIAIRRGSKSTR